MQSKSAKPYKSINKFNDVDTQLSKEIDLFTLGGGRGEYFQAAFTNKCWL